jgi:pimeloyl-ACP methyl ester carboxylesterase
MYLNQFAETLAPLDMTRSAEFGSLLQSAADLGIPHSPNVRYVSRHTVVRGQRFHFLEWGQDDAAAVLLLHGGNQSAHSWDLVSLHLADRYHVYALDQRGHGDSEWSRDVDYSVQAKAADAAAFIDDQRMGLPIVFGHSMGGQVTMRMVLSGAKVKGVVLVDVGPELSPAGIEVVQNFVTRNVEFDDLDVFLDNVAKYDPYRPREHIARTVKYNMLRRADGKYVSKVDHRRAAGEAPAPLQMEDVGGLRSPVLVVRGDESHVLEKDAAVRFVAALPDGRLATVAHAGHNVHGANTPGFLDAIAPFLADLR